MTAVRDGTPHEMDLSGFGALLFFSDAFPAKRGCAGHIGEMLKFLLLPVF